MYYIAPLLLVTSLIQNNSSKLTQHKRCPGCGHADDGADIPMPVRTRPVRWLSQAAGIPTEFKQLNGTSHGFLHFGLPQTVEAMEMSARALRTAFGLA